LLRDFIPGSILKESRGGGFAGKIGDDFRGRLRGLAAEPAMGLLS
jgi:hypothetical protein